MNGAVEIWSPVVGYGNRYLVSNLGRVWSRASRKCLAPLIRGGGYQYVDIGRRNSRAIHDLVCTAFHGPRPQSCEPLHGDGDSSRNHSANLRWGTRKQNVEDTRAHGRLPMGERVHSAKLTVEKVLAIRADPRSHAATAIDYGVSLSTVSKIRLRQRWKHV